MCYKIQHSVLGNVRKNSFYDIYFLTVIAQLTVFPVIYNFKNVLHISNFIWRFIQTKFLKIKIEFKKIQLLFSKFKKQFLNFYSQSVEYSDICIWKF